MPWLLHNLFTTVFRSGCKELLIKLLAYGAVTAVSCGICIGICCFVSFNSLILTLALRLVICTIVSNIIFFAIFFRSGEFKSTVSIVDSLTKANKTPRKIHVRCAMINIRKISASVAVCAPISAA